MDGVIRVHHSALTVSDLERSEAFYSRLGFEPERRLEFGGPDAERLTAVPGARLAMAFLTLGRFRLELVEYEPPGRHDYRRNNDVGTPHLCLQVQDIEAAYARLSVEGVSFVSSPIHHPSGVSMIYLTDPDGITVELLEIRDEPPPGHR